MWHRKLRVMSAALLLTTLTGAADSQPRGEALDTIAERLLSTAAGVSTGEKVLITGSPRDVEFLESLAVQVRRRGAFPLVRYQTDALARRLFADVPPELDSQTDPWSLLLAQNVDVVIEVDPHDRIDIFAHIPMERLQARWAQNDSNETLMAKRGVRFLNIGGGLYPAQHLTQSTGLTKDVLSSLFWSGLAVDLSRLASDGQRLSQRLSAGKHVRIRHPNGTDLRFRIDNRPSVVDDGVISATERLPGISPAASLPAGTVALAPVSGSAEGRLVVNLDYDRGQPIEGLRLDFRRGRVTQIDARSGLEAFLSRYRSIGAGKDELGTFVVGYNPNIQIPPGSRLAAGQAAGAVTLGLGYNVWAGGSNEVSYSTDHPLIGATVEIDGQPLIVDGRLLPLAP
jgi:leucyl aminopeptidase (aminopeptidase T)